MNTLKYKIALLNKEALEWDWGHPLKSLTNNVGEYALKNMSSSKFKDVALSKLEDKNVLTTIVKDSKFINIFRSSLSNPEVLSKLVDNSDNLWNTVLSNPKFKKSRALIINKLLTNKKYKDKMVNAGLEYAKNSENWGTIAKAVGGNIGSWIEKNKFKTALGLTAIPLGLWAVSSLWSGKGKANTPTNVNRPVYNTNNYYVKPSETVRSQIYGN